MELLIVLAIVGVIMAILLPVLARSREKARQTVCASNLRQIGIATLQYAADHDDMMFPRRYTDVGGDQVAWDFRANSQGVNPLGGDLGPYLKDAAVWWCPDASGLVNINGGPSLFPPYGLNAEFGYFERRQGSPVKLAAVGVPAETILAADSARIGLVPGTLEAAFEVFAPSHLHPYVHGLHGGLANVLWLDGHVTARRPVAPFFDTWDALSIAQLQERNMGFILKGPYAGNAQTDDYYYELIKP